MVDCYNQVIPDYSARAKNNYLTISLSRLIILLSRARSTTYIMPQRQRKNRKMGGRRASHPGNQIRIQRSIVLGVNKTTVDSGDFNELSLGGFAGSSDISSLFQQYRIRSAKVTYKLVSSPNNPSAAFPTLYTAPQYISSTIPSSRDEVLQYQNMRVYQFAPSRTEVTYTYTPKVNRIVYRSAVASSYEPVSCWLSTQDLNAQHYYSVEWLDRYNTTTNPEHTVEKIVTITVDCRQTR